MASNGAIENVRLTVNEIFTKKGNDNEAAPGLVRNNVCRGTKTEIHFVVEILVN